MLTFFRRIRKGFLRDGATSKYLLYTIGEIALVVIGILIALQINAWNNDSINRIQEKNYLLRIVKNLEDDLIELNLSIESNDIRLVRSVWVLEALGRNVEFFKTMESYRLARLNHPDLDSLLNRSFGRNLINIRMYNLFYENENTFQEILANGKMDIVRNEDLKIAIQSHYSQIREKKWLQVFLEKRRNDFTDFLLFNGISMYNELSLAEVMNRITNKEHLYAQIENFIFMTVKNQRPLREGEDSIKKSTENLIADINDYLQEMY